MTSSLLLSHRPVPTGFCLPLYYTRARGHSASCLLLQNPELETVPGPSKAMPCQAAQLSLASWICVWLPGPNAKKAGYSL